MRNPRWTWTAAMAAMGLAASSPWIEAQTIGGKAPGSRSGDAANVQIAPANTPGGQNRKQAAPAMDPAEAAMLRSRSVRSVLRNGLDYIKYQQFEKALAYLREAERRKQELNPQELTSLRQGIDAAQEGLRAPASLAGYAKSRKPQAGSIAIAGRTPKPAPVDSAMIQASSETPAQEPLPLPSASPAKAESQKTAKPDGLATLEPIPADVLAKNLPSAADLARSKSISSARQQYASAGEGGSSDAIPPLKAPAATKPIAETASIETDKTEPVQAGSASTGKSMAKANNLPKLESTLSDNAPPPLPGSPTASVSRPEPAPAAIDEAVATVKNTDAPATHQPAPSLPKLSVPDAPADSLKTAVVMKPEQSAGSAEEIKAPTEVAVTPAAPVVETPALPPLEPADQPATELVTKAESNEPAKLPATEAAEPALPELPATKPESLPELPAAKQQVEETVKVTLEEPASVVAETVKSVDAPASQPQLEADSALPPLPVEGAKALEASPKAAAELDVKPARAELADEAQAPQAKPVQDPGGIPVLTPLPEDEDASARPAAKDELPPLPIATEARKPSLDSSLPALPVQEGAAEAKASAETSLPPLPSAEAKPAVEPNAASEAVKPAEEPAQPAPPMAETAPAKAETGDSLPPLPTATETAPKAETVKAAESEKPTLPALPETPAQASSVTDTPPVPTAPAGEPAPERVALKEASAATAGDSLPPLPAEEVAGPAMAASARSGQSAELGKISDRFLTGLSAERRREIEQLARVQVERGGGATPGLSPLGTQPPEEAGAAGRAAVPGSNSSLSATDDPLVRLELPRAPSPAEARPIRAILLPEQFDNLKPRQFNPRRKLWASAATAHYPLYFQDPSLERYGISIEQRMGTAGRKLTYAIDDPKESKLRNQIASPFVSTGLFALQIATWPFKAIADPPWESEYDLGYYRPGDKVPEDTVVVPWKGVGPLFKGNRY